jgi:MerR family mercuric resistance operon transcriptional regulator
LKISEFAKAADVNVETVRYYHRSGVLDTPASGDSYRQYTQDHLKQMEFIKNAKFAGFTLADIKQLKSLDAVRNRGTIRQRSEQKKRELEKKLEELQAAKVFLDGLITECKKSSSQLCPIVDALRGTDSGD